MKAITYLALYTLGAAAMVSPAFSKELAGWSTDFEKAFAQAKKERKAVLVEFTGSDWCQPCIIMRKNVFSKKEFVDAARKNFILVELDFPNGDKDLKKKNEPYAEKYKIDGFPTVILFDADGKEFTRFPATKYPETDLFLKHLDDALDKKELD